MALLLVPRGPLIVLLFPTQFLTSYFSALLMHELFPQQWRGVVWIRTRKCSNSTTAERECRLVVVDFLVCCCFTMMSKRFLVENRAHIIILILFWSSWPQIIRSASPNRPLIRTRQYGAWIGVSMIIIHRVYRIQHRVDRLEEGRKIDRRTDS